MEGFYFNSDKLDQFYSEIDTTILDHALSGVCNCYSYGSSYCISNTDMSSDKGGNCPTNQSVPIKFYFQFLFICYYKLSCKMKQILLIISLSFYFTYY